MTTFAATSWQKIRTSRTWSGAAAFLSWWKAELVDGLPPRYRDFLDHRPERLMARQHDDEILLWRDHNGHSELGRFRVGDDAESASQVVRAALSQLEEENPRTVYLIDEDQVLRKTLVLPAATEENLRQVIAFEMDRHTPFKAEQVYFDFRDIQRDPEARNLRVEMVVVLRDLIDDLAERAADSGLTLDVVDVCYEADDGVLAVLDVNLLPAERRARRSRRQLHWNLGLAALFVALLYAAMWQSLITRENAIDDLRMRSSQTVVEATSVSQLRDQLQEAREAARFLTDKKDSKPLVMDLLEEVTRLLPTDTWLQRLQINEEKVTLTGQSPDAASLIALLQQNSLCLESPSLRGAITPDPQSGKERFTIEATLKTCKPAVPTGEAL